MQPPEDLRRGIEPLLAFLPMMESRHAGEWRGGDRGADGTITMPWFEYSPKVLDFIRACSGNGWIEVFAWPDWVEEARRLHDDPAALQEADIATIRKLLTLHIRADRFNEGHLAAVIEDGHMATVLRRLEVIRNASG